MSFMGQIEADELQWCAVRMAPPRNRNRRTAVFGVQYETKAGRGGRKKRVPVEGTGERRFVHVEILRRAGFEAFLPVRQEWRVVNRYTKEKRLVEFPLAGDWMFVGWPVGEDRWADLMDTGMVLGVAGTGGHLLGMSSSLVAELMRQWGGKHQPPEHYRFMRTHAEFDPGDTVRVVDGPLADCVLKVEEVQGSVAKVFAKMLGKEMMIPIDVRSLVRE